MPNRFYIWERDAAHPEAFEPEDVLRHPDRAHRFFTDRRYFYGIAHQLDELLGDAGLTFLVTWNLDLFEERFRDSVVILVGDEKYQTPSYASAVRMIFKTGGISANALRHTLSLPAAIAWRAGLRDARNAAYRAWRRAAHRGVHGGAAPVHELPLGYFALRDVPFVPFEDRSTDIFFAGSIEDDGNFTLRPRSASRRQMAEALCVVTRELPQLSTDFSTAGTFVAPEAMLAGDIYSQRLMNARVALCPRGNFDETFRLFEAARSGCVVAAERLPARWYYRDAPVIEINRWADLSVVLANAFADPAGLAQRARATRDWWVERVSERAVAAFMTRQLEPGHT